MDLKAEVGRWKGPLTGMLKVSQDTGCSRCENPKWRREPPRYEVYLVFHSAVKLSLSAISQSKNSEPSNPNRCTRLFSAPKDPAGRENSSSSSRVLRLLAQVGLSPPSCCPQLPTTRRIRITLQRAALNRVPQGWDSMHSMCHSQHLFLQHPGTTHAMSCFLLI